MFISWNHFTVNVWLYNQVVRLLMLQWLQLNGFSGLLYFITTVIVISWSKYFISTINSLIACFSLSTVCLWGFSLVTTQSRFNDWDDLTTLRAWPRSCIRNESVPGKRLLILTHAAWKPLQTAEPRQWLRITASAFSWLMQTGCDTSARLL